MVVRTECGHRKHPTWQPHLKEVEDGGRCLQQGYCRIFSSGQPLARLLKWTVGVGCTRGGERGQRLEREGREGKREGYCHSDRQEEEQGRRKKRRRTKEGKEEKGEEEEEKGREILTWRFIRILMIPVREQYKAKETDVRPEVDGGGQGTGLARKGDVSRKAETGGLGQAGEGEWLFPARAQEKWTRTLTRPRRSPLHQSCPSLPSQAQSSLPPRDRTGAVGEGKWCWETWGGMSGPRGRPKRERRDGVQSP